MITWPAGGYRNDKSTQENGRLNRSPNIRIKRDLVVVENDISYMFFLYS